MVVLVVGTKKVMGLQKKQLSFVTKIRNSMEQTRWQHILVQLVKHKGILENELCSLSSMTDFNDLMYLTE